MIDILSKLTFEHWCTIIGLFVSFTWAFSIFLFGRITVKHIEREMAKEGLLPPIWDSYGIRLTAYAGIIIFPNLNRHASLVDIEATKRHARKKDFFLALFLQGSSAVFFTVMFIWGALYGSDM